MRAYRIIGWSDFHESYEIKKLKAEDGLAWISSPTSHDRSDLRRLLRHPEGLALYGAYHAMAEISARLPKQLRGWLVNRDSRPLDAEDLADLTGAPAELFQRALEVLSDPDGRIRWLELAELSAQHLPADLLEPAAVPAGPLRSAAVAPAPVAALSSVRSGLHSQRSNTGLPVPDRRCEQPERLSQPGLDNGRTGAIEPRVLRRTGPEMRNGVFSALQNSGWKGQVLTLKLPDVMFEVIHEPAAGRSEQRRSVEAQIRRFADHAERAEIGADFVQCLVEAKRYVDRKGGNYWAVWQTKTNQLLLNYGL